MIIPREGEKTSIAQNILGKKPNAWSGRAAVRPASAR